MPFSLRRLTKLQLIALFLLAFFTITAFTMIRPWSKAKQDPVNAQTAANEAAAADTDLYINRVLLSPNLRDVIKVVGNRFEKPGKERVTWLGTISRPSSSATKNALRLTLEYPGKLRLEEDDNGKQKVTVFDGTKLDKQGDALKKSDEDEIESLLADTVDHFFEAQAQGQAMRYLGSRFRISAPLDNETPKNSTYKGPFYDLYEVIEQTDFKKEAKLQRKAYGFNSDTQLLEIVRYQADRNGVPVNVEVKYGGWRKVEDQQVPTTITRLEDDRPVLMVELSTTTFSKKADDGIFTLPKK